LNFTLPKDVFHALLPFKDVVINLQLFLERNKQIVDKLNLDLINLVVNLDNTLNQQQPQNLHLVMVPKQYHQLIEKIDFYFDGECTNVDIINTIMKDINPIARFDKPLKVYKFYDIFIPYMSRIKCLAYACREFGYSNDVYHAYVDHNGFKLIDWNQSKSSTKYVLTLYPNSYQVKDAFISNISYLERVDITRRTNNQLTFVVQTPNLIKEPYQQIGNGGTYDAKSLADNSLQKSYIDSQLLDIDLIAEKKIFMFDLLDRVDVNSNVSEFLSLRGQYMVTDIEVTLDSTKQTFVPYTRLRISKRG